MFSSHDPPYEYRAQAPELRTHKSDSVNYEYLRTAQLSLAYGRRLLSAKRGNSHVDCLAPHGQNRRSKTALSEGIHNMGEKAAGQAAKP